MREAPILAVALVACAEPAASPPARPVELEVPPLDAAAAARAAEPPSPQPYVAKAPGRLSYEEALAWANARPNKPPGDSPLTDAQLSDPFKSPALVQACGAPETMKVTVRVLINQGSAKGVTILTSPADAKVAACVDAKIRTFAWPPSVYADSITITY